jgi:hypothetical protein
MATSNGEREAARGCEEAAVGGGGVRPQLARGDWNWRGKTWELKMRLHYGPME